MTQIKEVNTLNTVASVRRAAQESMRPVIQEIERKMGLIDDKMQEISKQMFEFAGIEKKMQRNEESNRYLHGQLVELSDNIHHAELQMAIDRQKMEKIDDNYKEQIRKLQREREKQDLAIEAIEAKNAKAITEISQYLKSMKLKEAEMHSKFQQIIESTNQSSVETQKNNEQMRLQFQEMRNSLNFQLKESSRRLQLLDMYQVDKELSYEKFTDIYIKIDGLITQDQLETYRQCNTKQQERIVEHVQKILDDSLSEQTRTLISQLPSLKDQIQHCLSFEDHIQTIAQHFTQVHRYTHALDERTKFDHQEINHKLQMHIQVLDKQRKKMEQSIEAALALEGVIQTKIDQYSDTLKAQLRAQNQRKSRELYEEIKQSFVDTRQAMRQRQLQRVIQERKKLFDRCVDMESLGGKIQHVLSNFATKFTKIRSDNELFEERVSKELQKLHQLQASMKSHNALIGRTLAEMAEAVLASYCIDIEQASSPAQQILLTTLKDGVIYQKFANKQPNSIMYRRKLMNPVVLRKAVAFALLQIYDELMSEECCLKWSESSPCDFFRLSVEPIYMNLYEKKEVDKDPKVGKYRETIDFSTVHQRQTISSFEQVSHSRNISTMRSRRNRYNSFQSDQIFKHKSNRRVRMALNSTLGMN